jgi:carbonic anhydrase
VEAALGTSAPHAHVGTIVSRIRAAIAGARAQPGDALDNAVRANVAASVNQVRSAKPLLAPAVQKGDVKVVGGRYDLDTGVVEILP